MAGCRNRRQIAKRSNGIMETAEGDKEVPELLPGPFPLLSPIASPVAPETVRSIASVTNTHFSRFGISVTSRSGNRNARSPGKMTGSRGLALTIRSRPLPSSSPP